MDDDVMGVDGDIEDDLDPRTDRAIVLTAGTAAQLQGRAELMRNILPHLVKCCNARNIKDLDGNPYVDSDACERIANIVGISLGSPKIEKYWEDDGDGKRVFCVDVIGEAQAFGRTVTEIGGCTSEDLFYHKRVGDEYVQRLPMSKLRLEVTKKAMANWQGRAIRTVLGLKELTWEELEKVGFKQSESTSVKYRKESEQDSDRKDKAEECRGKIAAKLMADCGNNKEAAQMLLKSLTTFEKSDGSTFDGYTSTKKLSEKFAFRLWGEIKSGGKGEKKYLEKLVEVQKHFGMTGDGEEDL